MASDVLFVGVNKHMVSGSANTTALAAKDSQPELWLAQS